MGKKDANDPRFTDQEEEQPEKSEEMISNHYQVC